MAWRKSRWLPLGLVGLVLAVGLPLVGHWLRQDRSSHGCALDGRRIEPLSRVHIVAHDGESLEFCSTSCAEIWLERQKLAPRAVLVTDETSGAEIEAGAAYFVRSFVRHPATGSTIHVFRDAADAARHAERYHGHVLSGTEAPLLKRQLTSPENGARR
jgi:ribosomal protein L24E